MLKIENAERGKEDVCAMSMEGSVFFLIFFFLVLFFGLFFVSEKSRILKQKEMERTVCTNVENEILV